MKYTRVIDGEWIEDNILFDNGEKPDSTVYLDRMWQWDHKKYDKCAIKNFGKPAQMLDGFEHDDIEQFLCDYFGRDVELCKIEKGIRPDNGYPWYRIDYKEVTTQKEG